MSKETESAEKPKKMIVVSDCMECPKLIGCEVWKKLKPKQRFTLKTGVGIGQFILKDCPLTDFSNTEIDRLQNIWIEKIKLNDNLKIQKLNTENKELRELLKRAKLHVQYQYKVKGSGSAEVLFNDIEKHLNNKP